MKAVIIQQPRHASYIETDRPRAGEGQVLVRVASVAVLLASPLVGRGQVVDPSPSVKALKQLSVEELMDLEVTSVSKHPEKCDFVTLFVLIHFAIKSFCRGEQRFSRSLPRLKGTALAPPGPYVNG